jgi:fused signal recognition particle receptor
MDFVVWIVLALVVAAVAAYFLTRKPALPAPEEEKKLPPAEGKALDAPQQRVSEPVAAPAEKAAEKVSLRPAERVSAPASTERAAPSVKPEAAEPSAPSVKPEAVEAPPEKPAEKLAEKPAEKPAKPPRKEDHVRDVSALKKGLTQTRTGWMQRLFAVFTGKKEIDPALLDEIEETLLTGDVGGTTTKRLVDGLKERLDRKELADVDRVWDALKADSIAILDVTAAAPFGGATPSKPLVILMAGVNGAGKTTTIAKLATRYKEEGRSVLLAAGDTFRAAAVAQLEMWGKRVGVPVHKGKEGAKPSAVLFEAVKRGVDEGFDVIIADTAGRLQTKAPLMEELRKIREACGKAMPGAPHEVLLVLDATTGQNAIVQAEEFSKALPLTGVVLTKLDGTAKGGVILAVAEAFKLPVRFIGVGEKSDDLREFDARDFIEALFARGDDNPAA